MKTQKPFGEKNNQGQQHNPGNDHTGPNKDPKDQAHTPPRGPGERSDEESIGRPVQLDKEQRKPRQPGKGLEEDGPPKAGV